MGLIDSIKQAVGKVNVKLPFVRLIGHEKAYGKSPLEGNYDEQAKAYRSWAYAASTRVAFSIARAKLRLYKERMVDGKKELDEITEHPFLELLKEVNPNFNRFELMTLLSLYQDLIGCAYWWMPKGRLRVPVSIWPIPSQWMRVVPHPQKFIAGYVMKVPGVAQPVPFPADEIVQFRYPNPNDLYYGMSPTLAAAFSIDINKEFKTWGINFINNNAQPAGVLQTEKTISVEQYNRLRDQWNSNYRGAKNAGKFAILGQGLKYEKTGSNLSDLAFQDVNSLVRDETLAMYGVPKSILGIVEDVNRANADATNLIYQRETILPRLMLIEEKINEKIMPMYDEGLVVKFDNPVPEDKEFRLKEQSEHIKSGYSSIDDERELDDLEPYNQPETQNPLIPFNVVPAGEEREEPTVGQEEEKSVKANVDDNKIDVFDATVRPQERLFERAMRKYFKEQNDVIVTNLAKYKAYTKDEGLEFQLIWNMNEQNEKLKSLSEPHIKQAVISGVEIVGKELGVEFTLFEPKILRAMKSRINSFAPGVNEVTEKILTDAIQKGEGINDIALRLQKINEFNLETRARRIAQTEIIGATNDGQMQAARTMDMTHKKWLTAKDEKVRPTHNAAGKQGFILIDDEFGNGLQYPGDRKGSGSSASELINCRCTHRTIRRK